MTPAEYIEMNTQILQFMMMIIMFIAMWFGVTLIIAIRAEIARKKYADALLKEVARG